MSSESPRESWSLERAARDWHCAMRRGDFEEAWLRSDEIRRSGAAPRGGSVPRHLQSVWDGSPIDGAHVLVRCYHGLGDTLQFVRYAPLVKARARTVTLWSQPALVPLLRGIDGVDTLLPLHDAEVGIEYDVDVEIMELPYLFRTTIATIPRDIPYLEVSPPRRPRRVSPIVGLVWNAGRWAPHRSIDLETLAPLLRLPVTCVALQHDAGSEGWTDAFGSSWDQRTVLGLARALRGIDLLLTIDSMPAHLAGALGVPVWTLLCADADWRWMSGRDDTPWYPTMRLFRQREPGNWAEVVGRVVDCLGKNGYSPL
jgi:hypothetical protein